MPILGGSYINLFYLRASHASLTVLSDREDCRGVATLRRRPDVAGHALSLLDALELLEDLLFVLR